jgi:chromosome segregation protein
MAYIKKMVMHGFKSFARRTEIVFDRGINVVLGPNGSGKSNISDALCFVLGRLSIKSMRAAKSRNLLFMGSKFIKPAKEASVELVFDNTDGAFGVERDEISLKRVIRSNGQGIYKINDETKTRAEVIEILAHAGIDPYGFNMVLQGQIQAIVKMHPEDRRKIIEEVAGIAIYESRKEKSLHELEKTEEKLKEIGAILRERGAFLRNLDKERTQALRFKELEESIKRTKGTIVHKKRAEKEDEINSVDKNIAEKTEQLSKRKLKAEQIRQEIEKLGKDINDINKSIQKASGLEQETLKNQVAQLRADIEGLRVRKETYEHRKSELEKRIDELTKSIPSFEKEIAGLREKSPIMAQKAEDLKKKKAELAELEDERRRLLTVKSDINSFKERIKDKEKQIARLTIQSENVLKQMEDYTINFEFKSEELCAKAVQEFAEKIKSSREEIEMLNSKEIENEKVFSIADAEIRRSEKIKGDVGKIDTCPLCQSKITKDHIEHVFRDCDGKIKESKDSIQLATTELSKIRENKQKLMLDISLFEDKLDAAEREIIKHKALKDKNIELKRLVEEEKTAKSELSALEEKRKVLEGKSLDISVIEERYDSKLLEIEEISSRTMEDVDTTLLYKQRDLENTQNIVKRAVKDLEELKLNSSEISENYDNKKKELIEKEALERELNEKFKQMFEKRESIQKEIQDKNIDLAEVDGGIKQIEDIINNIRISKAKLDAEKEALDMEMIEYSGIELMQGSIKALEERLMKAQESIKEIGSINMRALEVYEEIKKEYDDVELKVKTLEEEKVNILKIVEEIDKKKTREFMRSFRAINALFSDNFSKLYNKGVAFLEIENKEDIFAGGVNIAIKLAKGKYFDVTSLSGGEQTLVALSLLFSIQEHKPYHFYVFDEIDAALDKRNSERLAGLLQQYMKSGQYIVITHNDAIILNANVLYGVSMHEGVSKILSLEVKEIQEQAQKAAESGNMETLTNVTQEILVKKAEQSLKEEETLHDRQMDEEEIESEDAKIEEENIELEEEELEGNAKDEKPGEEEDADEGSGEDESGEVDVEALGN